MVPSHLVRLTTARAARSALELAHPRHRHALAQPCRSLSTLHRAYAARSAVKSAHGQASDTTESAPLPVAQVARRQPRAEAHRAKLQAIKKLSFRAYNAELSKLIKSYTDWESLLTFLTIEMSNTLYNSTTARQPWVNPNTKHMQWTHDTLSDIVRALIKTRKSRQAVKSNDELMLTLNRICVALECSMPALHNEYNIWRYLYHPYRYLRSVVDEWQRKKFAARQSATVDEQQFRESDRLFGQSKQFVTDSELKQRALSRARSQSNTDTDSDSDDIPVPERHRWMLSESEAERASRRNGEAESPLEIIARVTNNYHQMELFVRGDKSQSNADADTDISNEFDEVADNAESSLSSLTSSDRKPPKQVRRYF